MSKNNANRADTPSQSSAVPGPTPPTGWAAARDAAIADFLDRFATDCPDRDVLADLMVAITRLARDGAGRGDLKLLTNSFKELRDAVTNSFTASTKQGKANPAVSWMLTSAISLEISVRAGLISTMVAP